VPRRIGEAYGVFIQLSGPKASDQENLRALSSPIAVWIAPQEGDGSAERLTAEDREEVLSRLAALVPVYPKMHLPGVVMKGYREPPASPKDCIFAHTTSCVSADLSTRVTPCQFGGRPVCSECGCMAPAEAALNVIN
jgi:hypothetical protein